MASCDALSAEVEGSYACSNTTCPNCATFLGGFRGEQRKEEISTTPGPPQCHSLQETSPTSNSFFLGHCFHGRVQQILSS